MYNSEKIFSNVKLNTMVQLICSVIFYEFQKATKRTFAIYCEFQELNRILEIKCAQQYTKVCMSNIRFYNLKKHA